MLYVVHAYNDTDPIGTLDYLGYQIVEASDDSEANDIITDAVISWAADNGYDTGGEIVTQTLAEPYTGQPIVDPSDGFRGCRVTRVPTTVTLMPPLPAK